GDPSGEGFETYTQIVHAKRRIGGYTSRGTQKALSTIERFPGIQKLLDIEEGNPIVEEELDEDKLTVFDFVKETGLKKIIVYPDHRDKPCFEYVSQVFNLGEPIYTDREGHEVYQISEASLATMVSTVALNYLKVFWGGEFLQLEVDDTSQWRWCGSRGELT